MAVLVINLISYFGSLNLNLCTRLETTLLQIEDPVIRATLFVKKSLPTELKDELTIAEEPEQEPPQLSQRLSGGHQPHGRTAAS